MFKTKNDLSETIRGKAVELLNARLADCTDLQNTDQTGPIGTSRGRTSSRFTNCSTRSTRRWRITSTTSPSGPCSSAASPKEQRGWWRSAPRSPSIRSMPPMAELMWKRYHRPLLHSVKMARRAIEEANAFGGPGHGRPVHGSVARYRQMVVVSSRRIFRRSDERNAVWMFSEDSPMKTLPSDIAFTPAGENRFQSQKGSRESYARMETETRLGKTTATPDLAEFLSALDMFLSRHGERRRATVHPVSRRLAGILEGDR